jgi:orotidine-5'-phosphate decarboxylase
MSPIEIAKILLKKKAVQISTNPPFTWTSGLLSPLYCDNRLLISFPFEREKIVDTFVEVIKENKIEFDVVGGTATAAIPWASFLAMKLSKPLVYIRPKPKEYGAGKQVEGTMPIGSRVLIVEDLISTGGSSIRSAEACHKEYNASCVGVLAIFSYELEKAKQEFTSKNIPLFTLSNIESLLLVAEEKKYITPEQNDNILRWRQNPEMWSQK